MILYPVETLHNPIFLSPDTKYSPSIENAILLMLSKCPLRVLMYYPLDILHISIVLSIDPEVEYSPSLENATLLTALEWPVRILVNSPVDIFHNLIVEFRYPNAKYSPFL